MNAQTQMTPTDTRAQAMQKVDAKLKAALAEAPDTCPVSGEHYKPMWADRRRPTVVVGFEQDVTILKTAEGQYFAMVEMEKLALRQAEADAERAAQLAEREARKSARGTAEDFAQGVWSKELSREDRMLANAVSHALRGKRRAEDTLADFAAKVEKDPEHALSWSMNAFAAAADRRVCGELLSWFDAGCSFEGMLKHFQDEALRKARSPSRSTSVTSNLLEQETGRAWAEATEWLLGRF
jgi:hypothetical protein